MCIVSVDFGDGGVELVLRMRPARRLRQMQGKAVGNHHRNRRNRSTLIFVDKSDLLYVPVQP